MVGLYWNLKFRYIKILFVSLNNIFYNFLVTWRHQTPKMTIFKIQKCISQPFLVGMYLNLKCRYIKIWIVSLHYQFLIFGHVTSQNPKTTIFKIQKCISQPFLVGFYWNLKYSCIKIWLVNSHNQFLNFGHMTSQDSKNVNFQNSKMQPILVGLFWNLKWRYIKILFVPKFHNRFLIFGHFT